MGLRNRASIVLKTHAMNRFNFILASLLILLEIFAFSSAVQAQKPVRGSGDILEQTRPQGLFTAVDLDFSANLHITCGTMPSLTINADENILPHIGSRVKGRTLFITQDKWIEPSAQIEIRIGTTQCSSLKTSGYSDAWVYGLDVNRFELDGGVGNVTLEGKVDDLFIRTERGRIHTAELEARHAEVNASGDSEVLIRATEKLKIIASEDAQVFYAGEAPGLFDVNTSDDAIVKSTSENATGEGLFDEPGEVVRVQFRLHNNSGKRQNFYVRGRHETGKFSYGFPMGANSYRKENWPVGTKVYLVNKIGTRKLIYTVEESDSGNAVDLF